MDESTFMEAVRQAEQSTEKQAEQSKKSITRLFANKKFLFIAGVVLLFLLLIPIFLLVFSGGKNHGSGTGPTPTPLLANRVKKAAQPTPAVKQTSQTLVYGTWTSQSSVVRAVDVATAKVKTVATLPLAVKKITVLTNKTLLYIDQTDSNDHGARISVYDIQQKQIVINIPADPGYGVDDYVLSPNKQYLAIWEVQFSPDTQTLQGGASRVYAVDLTQPSVTNLLYNETVTTQIPIHYPRAILNDGTVFTDQFIPNDPKGGTGWAYGMSLVDFDGTNKQDITTMTNGTYGSQPSLSPDGKYLLFAGYDGSNGDGTEVKNGYRQALLTPNTVELLDSKTLQRFKLPNLPNTNTYPSVQWDKQTGKAIISLLSPDTKTMGIYAYDLGTLTMKQIPIPAANDTSYGFIAQLTDAKTLIGTQSTDAANLGNLGEIYAYAYTQLATLTSDSKMTPLSVTDPFVQYIALLPENYFANVLGDQIKASGPTQPPVTFAVLQGTSASPQNFTFFLKTTLASLRLAGKSNPPGVANRLLCQNLELARCSALGIKENSPAYTACQKIESANNRAANACY